VKEGGICKRKDQRAVVIFVERKSEAGGDQEVVNCVRGGRLGGSARDKEGFASPLPESSADQKKEANPQTPRRTPQDETTQL
jgi:hypothetical protein